MPKFLTFIYSQVLLNTINKPKIAKLPILGTSPEAFLHFGSFMTSTVYEQHHNNHH